MAVQQNFCGNPEGKLRPLNVIELICYSQSFYFTLKSQAYITHTHIEV
jgi:hypothetical protein